MDITPFTECYDKHDFKELNNLDVNMLYNVVEFCKNKFTRDGMFFDIGSNAGSFVKVLNYCNINNNIHCFEPHPVLHQTTKQVYPYVNMNNYCLGNIDGNIDIYIPQWSVGLSSVINRPVFSQLGQQINKLNVKCQKLDTYCNEHNITNINFVKIDVEGAEKFIFEGAKELLKNKQIKCGIFEVGQTLYDANTHENEICDILLSYGYILNKTFSKNDYVFYLP